MFFPKQQDLGEHCGLGCTTGSQKQEGGGGRREEEEKRFNFARREGK
jgi:hypothetical protein